MGNKCKERRQNLRLNSNELVKILCGGATFETAMVTMPQVKYLTADHLRIPRIVTDAAGTVISRHDYTAFGDEVSSAISKKDRLNLSHRKLKD